MADYYMPTIIQPTIPLAAMTLLERLVLSQIFSAETDGDGFYLYADETPNEVISLDRDELAAALAVSRASSGAINAYAAERLAAAPSGACTIDLDLTMEIGWERILQDIVKRSPVLRYVAAVSAFTCSRMRPDGFGGNAVLITADAIMAKSTGDLIEDFLDAAGLAEDA